MARHAAGERCDVDSARVSVGERSFIEGRRRPRHRVGRPFSAPLRPPMSTLSKAHFSKMSADDLDALVAWIRTIPPKE
jgi:hypothetical protein